MVATYIACGIDPKKTSIFLQSAIDDIYKCNTLLGMIAPLNRVSSIPSIKDMACNANIEEVSIGLYNYPVLQ